VTAPQIIQEIDSAGGLLPINGNRVRYDLLKETRTRVDSLRARLEEVLRFLPTWERPEASYVHGQSSKMVNALARLRTFDQLRRLTAAALDADIL
jgi:hypothetical protein